MRRKMKNKMVKSSLLTLVLMMVMMMVMMFATSITTFAASAPTGLVQIKDYMARGSYVYDQVKTLANKIGYESFGLTNVYENINVYYFAAVPGDGASVDGYEYQFANSKGVVKKTFDSTGGSLRLEKFVEIVLLSKKCSAGIALRRIGKCA